MAATQFGVIYSIDNAHIRRYVDPTQDDELNSSSHCGPGEAMVIMKHRPYPSSGAWQAAVNTAVEKAAGKPLGDPSCCVVDQDNIVVRLIQADAAIDTVPDMTLVQAYAAIPLGSTYDPATGLFTAPGYSVPPFEGNENHPPSDGYDVPPTVIPKP